MKYIQFFISLLVSTILIVALSFRIPTGDSTLPPLGKFMSPFTGFWQNAEPVNYKAPGNPKVQGLKATVEVVYDDRLVPHIYAQNDHDAYFMQGYVTAQNRLWQMDFQTMAAAGRLSEVLGYEFVPIDQYLRRIGMKHGAEQTIEAMNNSPESKAMLEAYTNGINAYINQLSPAHYPIEYKLLDYAPEEWSPMKSALLLKFMSRTLTGWDDDVALTNALATFGSDFNWLYPHYFKGQSPIIPSDTEWPFEPISWEADTNLTTSTTATSNNYSEMLGEPVHDPGIGSNNWAVSGSMTASGAPILANDPHLELNLPSIWYEIHMNTPEMNVYGVSLPGSPGVIIGFNDDIAWGVTNAGRDVRNWYSVEYQDKTHSHYLYNGEWTAMKQVVEEIKVRGAETVYDTINFTDFGPIVYDRGLQGDGSHKDLAMWWTAHEASNEVMTFFLLNRGKNHDDYRKAISYFHTPGQNFVFASKSGDVAITQQGKFPIAAGGFGKFVLDAAKSTMDDITFIPVEHNPHVLNPTRGFVSSANQHPAALSYPYPYHGYYEAFRNRRINDLLAGMQNVTVEDMKQLQQDNYSLIASEALPTMLKYADSLGLESDYINELKAWDYMADADKAAPSYFMEWWNALQSSIWDEMADSTKQYVQPDLIVSVMLVQADTVNPFFDIQSTPDVETLADLVEKSYLEMADYFDNKPHMAAWLEYKHTSVEHLLEISAFSFFKLDIGGYKNIVNATSERNGPSWRMVVELSQETNAYGIYPGGQSGNPGSKYYDYYLNDWAAGNYHELFAAPDAASVKNPLFTQQFQAK